MFVSCSEVWLVVDAVLCMLAQHGCVAASVWQQLTERCAKSPQLCLAGWLTSWLVPPRQKPSGAPSYNATWRQLSGAKLVFVMSAGEAQHPSAAAVCCPAGPHQADQGGNAGRCSSSTPQRPLRDMQGENRVGWRGCHSWSGSRQRFLGLPLPRHVGSLGCSGLQHARAPGQYLLHFREGMCSGAVVLGWGSLPTGSSLSSATTCVYWAATAANTPLKHACTRRQSKSPVPQVLTPYFLAFCAPPPPIPIFLLFVPPPPQLPRLL